MLSLLFVTAAFAAKDATPVRGAGGVKTLPDSDVVASGRVTAPSDQVYEYLLDLRHHEGLWPPHCAVKWEHGDVHVGPGASARLTYSAGGMKRRLTAVISKVDEDRRVTIDHAGNKGFVTTWTVTPDGDTTQLEIHTWINPPPWPLKRFYFNKVQGEWERCHEQVIDKFDTVIQGHITPQDP